MCTDPCTHDWSTTHVRLHVRILTRRVPPLIFFWLWPQRGPAAGHLRETIMLASTAHVARVQGLSAPRTATARTITAARAEPRLAALFHSTGSRALIRSRAHGSSGPTGQHHRFPDAPHIGVPNACTGIACMRACRRRREARSEGGRDDVWGLLVEDPGGVAEDATCQAS